MNRKAMMAFAATAALAVATVAQARGVRDLVPDSPVSGESVVAVLELNGCESPAAVRTVGGAIRIEVVTGVCGVPPPEAPFHVTLGRLPAGTYPLEVSRDGVLQTAGPGDITSLVVRSVPIAIDERRLWVDYGGVWWDASRPGTGVFIGQQATGATFIAWFTQEAPGQPTFYTLQGGQWFATTFEPDGADYSNIYSGGRLFRTRSSPIGQPYEPGSFQTTAVGTATLQFRGSTQGTLTFQFDDGRTGELSLVRFPF